MYVRMLRIWHHLRVDIVSKIEVIQFVDVRRRIALLVIKPRDHRYQSTGENNWTIERYDS